MSLVEDMLQFTLKFVFPHIPPQCVFGEVAFHNWGNQLQKVNFN